MRPAARAFRGATPLRSASMQRCALLDWSVRLRGADPNYAPRTPQDHDDLRLHRNVASCAQQRARFAAQLLICNRERAKAIQHGQS
jgi:hypothetical protein